MTLLARARTALRDLRETIAWVMAAVFAVALCWVQQKPVAAVILAAIYLFLAIVSAYSAARRSPPPAPEGAER